MFSQFYQITVSDWTPIFNTTSPKMGPFNPPNIPEFLVKFSQKKSTDKYLYISINVNIYNAGGKKTANTNFIIYAEKEEGETLFTGYKRFYVDGPSNDCSRYVTLDYLNDFNFVMTTSAGQSDMFQFTKQDGVVHLEDMSECENYSVWRNVLRGGVKAELRLYTVTEKLNKYFSTEYKVMGL